MTYSMRGNTTTTSVGHLCRNCWHWAHPFEPHICTTSTKEAGVPAKQHMSVRLPGDLMDSLDVLAKYRKEDRTALVVRMLRYAIALKASTCDHETMEDRVCVDCGHRFVEPSDDY